MTTLKLALPLVLTLAACGQGPGVSAESTAGTDAGVKRAVEKSKGVEKKIDAKTTLTAPASIIIAEAMAELIARPIQADRERWIAAAGRPDFDLLAVARSDDDRRTLAAVAIVAAHAPRAGWEIEPEGKKLKAYALANSAIAEFASNLEASLAQKMGNQMLSDPGAARDTVRATLAQLPPSFIRAAALVAVEKAREELAQGLVPDLASGQGIAWTAGRSRYTGGLEGWEVKRGGGAWFGGGYAQGQRYEFELESSTAKTVSKKKSVEIHESDKQDTSDKATTEIK